MNYLHEIATQLRDAADELDRQTTPCNCGRADGNLHERGCPARNPSIESHWAKHLREDSKSLFLLAEACEPEAVTA